MKDLVAKVSSEADRCETIVLSQYNSYRCLTVVVPLWFSEDEKTLVTFIGYLTKLVGQLPPEKLMPQLPSFFPTLFDALGIKVQIVVFCLVDIYIVLRRAFLSYLGSLSSTHLLCNAALFNESNIYVERNPLVKIFSNGLTS
jgi:CLIP-associating protein 1/2